MSKKASLQHVMVETDPGDTSPGATCPVDLPPSILERQDRQMTSPIESTPLTAAEYMAFSPTSLPLREITEQALFDQISLAAVLVNGQGDILYISGRAGDYLEPAVGPTGVNNILKMVLPGLRGPLSAALRQFETSPEVVHHPNLSVKTHADLIRVNLIVRPVPIERYTTTQGGHETSRPWLYLVILETAQPFCSLPRSADALNEPREEPCDDSATHTAEAVIISLQHELQTKEERFQSALEASKNSNTELQSYITELKSVIEELQHANILLETSKRRLESSNAQLYTENEEMRQANQEMNDLFAGAGIGILYIDKQMNILRFTPAVAEMINLIETDIGRPVAHISTNLVDYPDLTRDIQEVMETEINKEVQVRTRKGLWYLIHIHPYRVLKGTVAGAAISFLDITTQKRTEEALRESENRLRILVDTVAEGILFQDASGKIMLCNATAAHMFGIDAQEAQQHTSTSRDWGTIREDGSPLPGSEHPSMLTLRTGTPCADVIMGIRRAQGDPSWIKVNTRPLFRPGESAPYAVIISFSDITELKCMSQNATPTSRPHVSK